MVIDVHDIKNENLSLGYSCVELYGRNIPRNIKFLLKWRDAVTLNACNVTFSLNPYNDTYTKMTGILFSIGISNRKNYGTDLVSRVSAITVLYGKKAAYEHT